MSALPPSKAETATGPAAATPPRRGIVLDYKRQMLAYSVAFTHIDNALAMILMSDKNFADACREGPARAPIVPAESRGGVQREFESAVAEIDRCSSLAHEGRSKANADARTKATRAALMETRRHFSATLTAFPSRFGRDGSPAVEDRAGDPRGQKTPLPPPGTSREKNGDGDDDYEYGDEAPTPLDMLSGFSMQLPYPFDMFNTADGSIGSDAGGAGSGGGGRARPRDPRRPTAASERAAEFAASALASRRSERSTRRALALVELSRSLAMRASMSMRQAAEKLASEQRDEISKAAAGAAKAIVVRLCRAIARVELAIKELPAAGARRASSSAGDPALRSDSCGSEEGDAPGGGGDGARADLDVDEIDAEYGAMDAASELFCAQAYMHKSLCDVAEICACWFDFANESEIEAFDATVLDAAAALSAVAEKIPALATADRGDTFAGSAATRWDRALARPQARKFGDQALDKLRNATMAAIRTLEIAEEPLVWHATRQKIWRQVERDPSAFDEGISALSSTAAHTTRVWDVSHCNEDCLHGAGERRFRKHYAVLSIPGVAQFVSADGDDENLARELSAAARAAAACANFTTEANMMRRSYGATDAQKARSCVAKSAMAALDASVRYCSAAVRSARTVLLENGRDGSGDKLPRQTVAITQAIAVVECVRGAAMQTRKALSAIDA